VVMGSLRAYIQVAAGLSEMALERVLAGVRGIVGDEQALPGHVQRQLRGLADDVVATGQSSRDLLIGVVRAEVERAVARLGLVTGEEAAALRRKVERLEQDRGVADSTGRKATPRRSAGSAPVTAGAPPTRRSLRPRVTVPPTDRDTAATAARAEPPPGGSAAPGTAPPSPVVSDAPAAPEPGADTVAEAEQGESTPAPPAKRARRPRRSATPAPGPTSGDDGSADETPTP
jgi:hypothetical protein